MQSFKDSKNQTWDIVINVGTAKRVKDLCKVDLFNLYVDTANEILGDPITFVNVLYVLCKSQADERKIDDITFGESLTGDSLDTAADALLTEVANFFPSARKAAMLEMKAKAEAVTKLQMDRALKTMREMTVEQMDNLITTKQPTK